VVPDRLVLTVVTSSPTPSPIPFSTRAALADSHWRAAMEDEYGALINNGTWELVPRPQGSNIVTDKWVFTHKLRADGTLDLKFKSPAKADSRVDQSRSPDTSTVVFQWSL
jgi:hypothetical protein